MLFDPRSALLDVMSRRYLLAEIYWGNYWLKNEGTIWVGHQMSEQTNLN